MLGSANSELSARRSVSSEVAGVKNSVLHSVARLKQVLEEENQILESGSPADHQPFIDKKNQILRELLSLQGVTGKLADIAEVRDALLNVRPLVTKNHGLLQAHTAALSDITGLLAAATARDEFDGTYSRAGDDP